MRQINASDFFSLSFDESLNEEMQNCQMDLAITFLNNSTKLVESLCYGSKFLHRLIAN